jgi:Fe-S-cluster containining protein
MIEAELKDNPAVENSPRLGLDDRFTFRCDPSLPCFTRCCHDVSILLTPYDVLRMKRALNMESSEFLEKYALVMQSKEKGIPAVFLSMDPQTGNCPFVGPQGCSIYAHRPWSCRMYPLGMAEPKDRAQAAHKFYFVVKEDICEGHGIAREISVREWMADQNVELCESMEAPFRALMANPGWDDPGVLTPSKMAMFYMAVYDLDRFRRFVFESKFLDFFDVDETRIEAIRTDDEELLEFAFDWLAYTLFHEKRMKLKKAAVERVPAADEDAPSAASR